MDGCDYILFLTVLGSALTRSSVSQLASHLDVQDGRMSLYSSSGSSVAVRLPASLQRAPLQPVKPSTPCAQLVGLSPGQARVCELFADHMRAVGSGARRAIEECQRQFKGRRWNCSMPYGSPVMGPVHDTGTKEVVAVAYCKRARVTKEFMWGGCGDNLEYGYQFAQNFIDVRERERQTTPRSKEYGRALMNRWNNEVGRKVDLVYLDDSPDYCRPDPESGSPGTEGRPCNRTARASEADSCETLCCGRGYNTMKRVVVEKCQCKFQWCCKVQCRTCQTRVELHTCK